MFSRNIRRGASTVFSKTQTRRMGGGAHWMSVSKEHLAWGEAFGIFCWLWVFHRARNDLPVVLGLRHPWEHAHDDHDSDHTEHVEKVVVDSATLEQTWDAINTKALNQSEDDEDDDDED